MRRGNEVPHELLVSQENRFISLDSSLAANAPRPPRVSCAPGGSRGEP